MEVNGVDYGIDIDSDNDGMLDAWEIANGFNLLDPSDAAEDADGDGQNNLAEFIAQTNPNSAASVFSIISTATNPAGTQFILTWSSVPGVQYQIWRSPSLAPNS